MHLQIYHDMTASRNYTVKDQVTINAGKERVWEILTRTAFIKKWDDVPETFHDEKLTSGSVLRWEGYATMTVVVFEEYKQLTFDLFLPKVPLERDQYQVYYAYGLTENNSRTILNFEIGDFGTLPDPENYYDATLTFVGNAKNIIKELAENL